MVHAGGGGAPPAFTPAAVPPPVPVVVFAPVAVPVQPVQVNLPFEQVYVHVFPVFAPFGLQAVALPRSTSEPEAGHVAVPPPPLLLVAVAAGFVLLAAGAEAGALLPQEPLQLHP